jgi:hypothetical protein
LQSRPIRSALIVWADGTTTVIDGRRCGQGILRHRAA